MSIKSKAVIQDGSTYSDASYKGNITFYCVLYIDRYSNRILESVYIERKNAESYRNQSSQKLHIESETVEEYDVQINLWCSNGWGHGDVLSFLNLHTEYDDAHRACYSNGRPSPIKISDATVSEL